MVIVITLPDGPVVLSLRQLELLLLFFADRHPQPARWTVPGNCRTLAGQGLIETYVCTHCGSDAQVYRITERGKAAIESADLKIVPLERA